MLDTTTEDIQRNGGRKRNEALTVNVACLQRSQKSNIHKMQRKVECEF